MPRTLKVIQGEGFTSTIVENSDKSIFFIGDFDVDADGANGQYGRRAAYELNDTGTELLANGGMKMQGNQVVFANDWGRNVVIHDSQPKVFKGRIIASKTAYKYPVLSVDDPSAYLDSETIPYICIPGGLSFLFPGIALGSKAFCKNTKNGKSAWAVVGDVGPRSKVGEGSIELARLLGINPDPRNGGTEQPIVEYRFWPGIPAHLDGVIFTLMRANGTYIDLE